MQYISCVSPLPLLLSNVTVYSFAAHTAYNVTVSSSVAVNVLMLASSSYSTLPLAVVDQPANVYPVFVNAFAVKIVATSYVQSIPSIVPVPLFALNATLYLCAIHTAYNVYVPFVTSFVISASSLYATSPLAVVAQPANVYPVLVNAFAVKFVAMSYVQSISAIVPLPPLLSNSIL